MQNALHEELESLDSEIASLIDIPAEHRTAKQSNRLQVATKRAEAVMAEIDNAEANAAPSKIRQPVSRHRPGPISSNGPFRSLGEQLVAIAQAGRPGARPDPRLYEVQAAATGTGESTPSDGGFLVQQDFSTELLQGAQAKSVLYPKTRKFTISRDSNSVDIPGIDETSRASSRWGGIISYWAGEGASLTASKPKFRNISLSLKKLTGLIYSSDELVADSSVLESVIRAGFEQEIAFRIDDAILRGTGAGEPLGILNGPSLVSVTGGSSSGTIVTADITAMISRLWPGSFENSEWYANVDTIPQLMAMTLGDSPLWVPGNTFANRPYATLMGRPIHFIEQASTVGTVGDLNLLDLSQYIVAEKGGLQMASSMHVQFLQDEMVYRFIVRLDGQPAWHSALTPYKGANTLSPFVTIATRS